MSAHDLECFCRECLVADVRRADAVDAAGPETARDLVLYRLGAVAAALLRERALVEVLATTGESAGDAVRQ